MVNMSTCFENKFSKSLGLQVGKRIPIGDFFFGDMYITEFLIMIATRDLWKQFEYVNLKMVISKNRRFVFIF